MMKIVMLVFVALSTIAPLPAKEIAKRCSASPLAECRYIFVDKNVSWSIYADGHDATMVGPYLSQFQGVVSAGEAPFKVLKLPDGKQVVFTLALEKEFRLAGPIFVIYFLDRSGKVTLRSEGDLILETVKVTELSPARSSFLVISMRSETGISSTTKVWSLSQPLPNEVYFDAGSLLSIETGNATQKGRIIIGHVDGPVTTLSWDSQTRRMIAEQQ